MALLDDLVDYHFRKIKPRYMKYQKLYEGKAKIFKKSRMKVGKNKPCNKIANDFCGQIIDTTVGYFLGNPITINYTEKENKAVGTQTAEADVGVDLGEIKTTDTAVQDELDGILQENYRDDLFMEWGKESMIKSVSHLLVYQDEQSKTTTVSAAFIKAGAVDLIGGTECGVEEHVKLFKKAGIWIEDGTITPEKGDIVVFNWDDATQPNDGYSDHIGVTKY